jgi:two-component system chemotaxis response regulator CheY
MTARVLVVDDSQTVRLVVARALKAAGYEVVEAADGVEALAKLAEFPETALVVCDINMPRMGGIELLEAMQARALPQAVIMLTTEGQPDLIQRAKVLGAKGWLVKPFKPALLLAAAQKLTGG